MGSQQPSCCSSGGSPGVEIDRSLACCRLTEVDSTAATHLAMALVCSVAWGCQRAHPEPMPVEPFAVHRFGDRSPPLPKMAEPPVAKPAEPEPTPPGEVEGPPSEADVEAERKRFLEEILRAASQAIEGEGPCDGHPEAEQEACEAELLRQLQEALSGP